MERGLVGGWLVGWLVAWLVEGLPLISSGSQVEAILHKQCGERTMWNFNFLRRATRRYLIREESSTLLEQMRKSRPRRC
uniref:Secreted protein n=1 Tax=Vespula pensylvanica TaxID=30213 RepID=A0A834UG90_VESPE|nr:hypothetical protein H0235_000455 [Vespula pensylvanica]